MNPDSPVPRERSRNHTVCDSVEMKCPEELNPLDRKQIPGYRGWGGWGKGETAHRYKVSFSSDEIHQLMVRAAQFCDY